MKKMHGRLGLAVCATLAAVVVFGVCLKSTAAPGGYGALATNVAPGFSRPLVVDLKHEAEIKALQDAVAKLEAKIAALEKDIAALKKSAK